MIPDTQPADVQRLAAELVAVSRGFWARGWALATSGNFSARTSDGAVLVTASGLDKGDLTEEDLLLIGLDGAPVGRAGARPSAETALHLALYRRFPGAA